MYRKLKLQSILICFLLCMSSVFSGHRQRRKVGNPKLAVTFPGTRWCGPGNRADDYDDLGRFDDTDKCCRDHDHCDDKIRSGEENHGLKNSDRFTRLHCKCDKQFFECLHAANSTFATFIGKQYFTFRKVCFKEDYPIEKCEKYETRLIYKRCMKYKLDEGRSKRYQWFDLPYYGSKVFPH